MNVREKKRSNESEGQPCGSLPLAGHNEQMQEQPKGKAWVCGRKRERDHREEGVQRDGHGVRYQGTVPLGLSLPQHTQEADERDEKKLTEC